MIKNILKNVDRTRVGVASLRTYQSHTRREACGCRGARKPAIKKLKNKSWRLVKWFRVYSAATTQCHLLDLRIYIYICKIHSLFLTWLLVLHVGECTIWVILLKTGPKRVPLA